MRKLIFILVCISLFAIQSEGQKIFSEGVLKYDVYVNNSDKPEGVYIVTVKNGFTKRELAMNNGYNNIVLYNHKTGKTISLNMDSDSKYALEMSAVEVQEKNKKFDQAVFTKIDAKKKLAGYNSISSNVTYTNGESADFLYTTELLPPNDAFNTMFPGLQGIPLQYEVKSNANMIIKFVAVLIETKSIDLKTFDIPTGYKIVTKAELEKIK